MRVVRNPDITNSDAALGMQRRGAALAGTAHSRDLTAVAQPGQHLVALQCSVDDGRDTVWMRLSNPPSDTGSSSHDLVGAEVGDELQVGRGGVGNYPEPVGLSELNGIAADCACGSGDRESLTCMQVQ